MKLARNDKDKARFRYIGQLALRWLVGALVLASSARAQSLWFSPQSGMATAAPDREKRDHEFDRPEVWFAPNDDQACGPNRDRYLNHDFPQLFDPKPAWDARIAVAARSSHPALHLDRRHRIRLGIGRSMTDSSIPESAPAEKIVPAGRWCRRSRSSSPRISKPRSSH